MKTIALTGASSMLGIALIFECLKNDVKVIAFIREDSPHIDRLPRSDYIKVIYCDITSLDNLNIGDLTADVFYHIGWTYTDKIGRYSPVLQERNIKYTLDAVHLSARLKCKRFIGTGSQAEYGRIDSIISPHTPVKPEIAYGVAKYAAGSLSRLECSNIGIDHIWVRVFSVYGTNDNEGTLLRTFISKAKNNEPMPLTSCEQIWDYLYEDDAGSALYAIGVYGHNKKVYCLGSGQPQKLSYYLNEIKNKINPNYKPCFGELSYTPNQVTYLCADISELVQDTGWSPKVQFAEGINRIIDFF